MRTRWVSIGVNMGEEGVGGGCGGLGFTAGGREPPTGGPPAYLRRGIWIE